MSTSAPALATSGTSIGHVAARGTKANRRGDERCANDTDHRQRKHRHKPLGIAAGNRLTFEEVCGHGRVKSRGSRVESQNEVVTSRWQICHRRQTHVPALDSRLLTLDSSRKRHFRRFGDLCVVEIQELGILVVSEHVGEHHGREGLAIRVVVGDCVVICLTGECHFVLG